MDDKGASLHQQRQQRQQHALDHPRDLESGKLQALRRSPSRASIPQSRDGDPTVQTDEGDEFDWGPSHPCFPHMNSHVPTNSPLYQSTRVIRVKRDWMQVGDLAPTFHNLYPEILDQHISEEQFRDIVDHVNRELISAFTPFSARAWADTLMSVATCWLWEDLGMTGAKTKLARLERWIEDWNHDVGLKTSISIIPLRRTGYMTLDFQILDPQIGIDPSLLSRPATRMTETQRELGEQAPYPIHVAPSLPSQYLSVSAAA